MMTPVDIYALTKEKLAVETNNSFISMSRTGIFPIKHRLSQFMPHSLKRPKPNHP